MPPVPSFVFLPSLFLPCLKCVSHIKAPLTITNWILALPGHWTNAQIIFIVSECYDKGGLRAGGDLTQHWLYRRVKIDNSLLLLHEIDSSFVFQTDCCSTSRLWVDPKSLPNKDCNFIHALKLFTICLAKDVTANFYDCLRKVWFLYFPFSIP